MAEKSVQNDVTRPTYRQTPIGMDREWPDKNREYGYLCRRIRTGHRKQSHCVNKVVNNVIGTEHNIDGIQKHISEKCWRNLPEPVGKLMTAANNMEKSPKERSEENDDDRSTKDGKIPKEGKTKKEVKTKADPETTPKQSSKCDYFPATCTINLCPSCRTLECNLNGNGKCVTMSYDYPDCNLITTTDRPSISAYSSVAPADDRNTNKTPSGINLIKASPNRTSQQRVTSSKYNSSPQTPPTPISSLPESIKPNFQSSSNSSFLRKKPSTSGQMSGSPNKVCRYLIPKISPPETLSTLPSPSSLPGSKNTSSQLFANTPVGSILNQRRTGINSKREPPKKIQLPTRLTLTSPILPTFDTHSLSPKLRVDSPDQLVSSNKYRSKLSAPSCGFDSKPPLPTNAYSTRTPSCNAGNNDFDRDKLIGGGEDTRLNARREGVGRKSVGDTASNNQYCMVTKNPPCNTCTYEPSCGGSGRVPTVNIDAGYISNPPSHQGTMDRARTSLRMREQTHGPTPREMRGPSPRDSTYSRRENPMDAMRESYSSKMRQSNFTAPMGSSGPPPRGINFNESFPPLGVSPNQLRGSQKDPHQPPYGAFQSSPTKPYANTCKEYSDACSLRKPSMGIKQSSYSKTSHARICCTADKDFSKPCPCPNCLTSNFCNLPRCSPDDNKMMTCGSDNLDNLCARNNKEPMLTLMWPQDFASIFQCLLYASKESVILFLSFLTLCLLQDLDPMMVMTVLAGVTVMIYIIVLRPSWGVY